MIVTDASRRIRDRVRFLLERLVVRGAHYRLLIIAAAIGLVSMLGGALVVGFDAAPGMTLPQAIWWAFLRLTDPGYLGDDRGVLLRIISTVLTVAGYVIFLGALIAILTQWLNERLRALEAGLTPLALNDHILILGWTNRTHVVVRELLLSEERVRRFLERRGARGLRIAVLAENVTSSLRQELRDRLGPLWSEGQLLLRSGSPLRVEHLRRVDFAHAGAVILPAADFAAGGAANADTHVIKTLLSMTSHPAITDRGELPLVVAELFDSRKVPVARRAYGGRIEVLASDSLISRLIAQNVRHPGLSRVYSELLTHGRGNEIYIRDVPAAGAAGQTLGEVGARLPHAVVLGVISSDGDPQVPRLNLPDAHVLSGTERLVLIARGFRHTVPLERPEPDPAPRAALLPMGHGSGRPRQRRVLIMGWSHKVPALLREFDAYPGESFEVTVLSTIPLAQRQAALERYGGESQRVRTQQLEADYTAPHDLERVHPESYDSVVLLGSDRLGTGEEADARTILGYLLVRELLGGARRPHIIVELLDAGNTALFRRRAGEVIVSPLLLSHMLAQVALRRELRGVFDELFGPGGAEIELAAAGSIGLAGTRLSFRELERAARATGRTALGVRSHAESGDESAGAIHLNPAREHQWTLTAEDEVILLTAGARAAERSTAAGAAPVKA